MHVSSGSQPAWKTRVGRSWTGTGRQSRGACQRAAASDLVRTGKEFRECGCVRVRRLQLVIHLWGRFLFPFYIVVFFPWPDLGDPARGNRCEEEGKWSLTVIGTSFSLFPFFFLACGFGLSRD
ncbi:hypothetical protein B0T16DRAFT_418502 [Cercophora newfieldiana]|uniref:Uncharacterized protein n=1 Tax=Cercophora newfieldiana TaxID=92897 RepID=A0AA40CKH5_9PEZI|nr:hypothetical protein B0T16DRAFT_418502 [Cercophora newfieldiana]